MQTEVKLKKAKIQLLMEQPFFASLVLRLKYEADTKTKTAITDGKTVWYNPEYIDGLNIDELKGVLVHEVMHISMLHHTRRKHRENTKWNHATDYAINPIIKQSGLTLPENAIIDYAYAGKSAESIYELLPTTNNENDGGTGDVTDPPAGTNLQQEEADVKQALAQAAMIAEKRGAMPGHLKRLVDEIIQPKVNWKEVLNRFLTEVTKNDYSWKKPSPRFLHCNLYLPTLESDGNGDIILIVDTSGSINHVTINQFAAEVADIASTFKIPLKILYVDAELQYIQDIDPDDPIKLEPLGGGGTDFRPGFTYINDNDLTPKAIVYLTDGCCHLFPDSPDFPVLWAQIGEYSFNPPFGEVISID